MSEISKLTTEFTTLVEAIREQGANETVKTSIETIGLKATTAIHKKNKDQLQKAIDDLKKAAGMS